MMRTRNFRVTKSHKGKKAYIERKVGECFQWNAHGQCSKGDSCSFSHDIQASGNSGKGQRRKGRSSSPASHSKTKQTARDKNPHRDQGVNRKNHLKRMKIPCRFKFCTKPSCSLWHPPVCQNYKSEKGCVYGDKCHFRHVEAEGKPNKRSKKGGAKGSVAILKESIQLGCVSQDSYQRNSILREVGKLGSNHAVKFSKGTWHQRKIREKKGPSRGIIKKCVPHEHSPCAPKCGERSHEETLQQEKMRPQSSMGFGENIYKLKNADKATF